MAIDTGLLFKIKADGSQAKSEARETARAVEAAFNGDPFGDFRARLDDMKRRMAALKAGAHDAADGVDDLDRATKRTGGRGGGIGQFIGALAQGDPAEVLQEIAQSGHPAGVAIAGIAVAAGAAALAVVGFTAAMVKMTEKVIEGVRETDLLAKNTALSATQIQGLQVVANLTGESVEDLAENYKKLGPEVQRFENLVRSSGAAIDEELRQRAQQAAQAWEQFKLTATGALYEIAREALPQVTASLIVLNDQLLLMRTEWGTVGAIAGRVLAGIAAGAIAAGKQIQYMIGGLSALSKLDIKGIVENSSKFGSGTQFGIDAVGAYAEIQSIATGQANAGLPGFPKLPKLGGGSRGGRGGGGRQDITESELQIRLLRAEQDEAQRGLNGTREAAERLYDVTVKLLEAERAQAASELPRGRAAKLAEIQQKEKEALEKYSELIKKVSDEELKPFEQLGKQINKDNAEALRLIQEQIEAERQLKSLRLERRDIEADLLEQSALDLARSGGSQLKVAERQARAASIREDVAFERAVLSIERERQQAEANEDFARVKELNALMEAEQQRHVATMAEIGRGLDNVTNLGAAFRNLAADMQATLPSMVQLAVDSFGQIADAAANGIQAFVTGQGTLRQAIGSIVTAMLEPYKKWAITKASIHFAAAAGDFAFGNVPGGVKHLAAGAGFVALAGLIGAAGALVGGSGAARAAGPSSGGGASASQSQNAGPRIINQDTKPQTVQIILRVEEGIVAQKAASDYRNNGILRQMIRNDVGAN